MEKMTKEEAIKLAKNTEICKNCRNVVVWALISSGKGSLCSGGLHFNILTTYTSSRDKPTFSNKLSALEKK